MTERLHFHVSFSCIGEGNGNHSSVLAWRIPGTEEPGGLPSTGLHRVGQDWSDLAAGGLASWFQDRCCASRHYIFIPSGSKAFYSQGLVFFFFVLFCFPADSASKSLVRIMSVTWPPLARRYLQKWRGRLLLDKPSYSMYHPAWMSKGADGRKQLHCLKTVNYYGDSVVAKIACVLVWVSFEVDSEIRI